MLFYQKENGERLMLKIENERIYNERILKVISSKRIQHHIQNFYLDVNNIHGFPHWLRVAYNGLMLADNENVSDNIVVLFAFFHDVKRHGDGFDPEHGQRGSDYLLDRAKYLGKHISREEIELAAKACSTHTDGLITGIKEIGVCWDADRLDLYRVALMPKDLYLSSETARVPEVKEWSDRSFISSYNKQLTFPF